MYVKKVWKYTTMSADDESCHIFMCVTSFANASRHARMSLGK